MKTYTTSEIAKMIDIHPNTVRLYEKYMWISKPKRQENGYRMFTDLHVAQFKLARAALKVPLVQNGLRKKAIDIIKNSAAGDLNQAIGLTEGYLQQIRKEQMNAEEAITIVRQILCGGIPKEQMKPPSLTRKETADYLQVTIDTLRNWELNGLLTVKRKQNGYRIYTGEDIKRLKVIRTLRCANYSLVSILRMLRALSGNPKVNIRKVIDTPVEGEDIVSVCDEWLTSLKAAENNAKNVLAYLIEMKKKYKNHPTL